MNKTAVAIGLVVAVILVFFAFSGEGQTKKLSGASFVDTYKATSGAMLIDVRTPAEFVAGHLDGAVNIDFENPTFAAEVHKLNKEIPYFVYCRSGNRSGQAITMMKSEGIQNISELQGGIVSNQSSLTLVTTPSASSTDYVVDSSDMVDGSTLIAGIPESLLSEKEKSGLIQMREEEKLARDVYTTLGAKWGTRVFSNIASSEQTHTDAVKVLLDRYGISDPSTDGAVGVFHSADMQKLYDTLTETGLRSLGDALIVGATIEDLDIRDLDVLMKSTDKQDILVTYSNLQKGSRNHMRAFVKNITSSGGTYTPQYITQDAFSAIITAPQERGRM